MYSLELDSITLNFDFLLFSGMFSVYCKKKFPWRGVRVTLICGYEDKYLYCYLRLCSFSKMDVSLT